MLNANSISLFLAGITILMWFLTSILFNIKKKKGVVSLILPLVFTFFSAYYIYLVFYYKPVLSAFEEYGKTEKVIIKPKIENYKNKEIFVVFQINGNYIKVGLDDEIEIKKNTPFVIEDIEGIDKEKVKVNLIGFVGNLRHNDGQDIGYRITYDRLMKNKEVGKGKYEIEVKEGNKKIGSIFIKFVD